MELTANISHVALSGKIQASAVKCAAVSVTQCAPENVVSGDTRYIPQSIKHFVWQRDRGVCTNCGSRRHLNYDHIRPVALGGATSPDNLRLLCFQCNQRAGIRTFGIDKMRAGSRGPTGAVGAN